MAQSVYGTLLGIASATERIVKLLRDVGFSTFDDFNVVDTLEHNDELLAFYDITKTEKIGSVKMLSDYKLITEFDCTFQIRLMGKSGDFSDGALLLERAENFFNSLFSEKQIKIMSLSFGNAKQAARLKRLERDLSLSIRLNISEVNYDN